MYKDWIDNFKVASSLATEHTKDHFDKIDIYTDLGKEVRSYIFYTRWMEVLAEWKFKLPSDLSFRYDFTKPYLILDWKNSMYFEIQLSLYEDVYFVGFWCKSKIFSKDNKFIEALEVLNKNNSELFNFKKDARGYIYVYTNKFSRNEVLDVFEIFTKAIKNLISYIHL